jgi:hypothetical protein
MVPQTAAFPLEVRSLTQGKPASAFVTRGYLTNGKASADTPDPTDSGAELARAGRTGGYRNLVSTYTFISTIAWASTSIDAFKTAYEAERFLGAQAAVLPAQDGKQDHWGRTIEDVEPIAVAPDLEPASGFRYSLSAGPDRMRIALIGLRVGRVVGWSEVARVDEVDPQPLAEALAQALRRQIEDVGA